MQDKYFFNIRLPTACTHTVGIIEDNIKYSYL